MDFAQVARELEIDEATYISLLKRFCELTDADISLLDRSLAGSDFDAVHSAAHSVKGASASLSLWDIYEAASAICVTAKAGRDDSIAELSAAIRKELNSLVEQVTHRGSDDDA